MKSQNILINFKMEKNTIYLTEPLEINKICRTCLGKKGDMKKLFGSMLDTMLKTVAQVEISIGDGLPDLICLQCVLMVSRAFTFKQQCERSDQTCRLYIAQHFENVDLLDVKPHHDHIIVPVELVENKIHNCADNDSDNNKSIVESSNDTEIIYEHTVEHEIITDDNITTYEITSHDDANELEVDFGHVKMEMMPIKITTINGETGEILAENFETFNDDNMPLVVQMKADEYEDSEKYYCGHCNTEFPDKPTIELHQAEFLEEEKEKKPFICTFCNKMFLENKILKRHVKTHMEKKPHVCNTCGMSFAESSNLTKHKKKHTGELRNVIGKPHLCSVCGKRFKWASSLSKHMKHHTKHKILTCDYCPKYYVEARSLSIHLRSHTGETPFICPTCNKGFTQMCNLEKHIRVHTKEKPFLCPVCSKGFSQSGYVAIHLRTHTGEKPYSCNDCGKCFAGSNTLAIHKRTHTGEKPYSCNICSKAFARQETAIIHQRTHTGEKPHICNICNRGFSSSGHLSGHMRSHSGDKRHACTICPRKFAGSSSLKIHLRSHGEKPFSCRICKKSFSQNSSLTTHLLTHNNSTEISSIVDEIIIDDKKDIIVSTTHNDIN